jgi:Nucleotidyl transferase AbiEii toxin, Type IV TA system
VIQREPNTLTCLIERGGAIKLLFFGLPNLGRIRDPLVCFDNRLHVAALDDLAATKVAVIQARAEAKDYVDIDALITAGVALPRALAAAKLIYGKQFAPTPSLKALTYFNDGDLPALPADVKRRLAMASAAVDPLRLPRLKRTSSRTQPPHNQTSKANQ